MELILCIKEERQPYIKLKNYTRDVLDDIRTKRQFIVNDTGCIYLKISHIDIEFVILIEKFHCSNIDFNRQLLRLFDMNYILGVF